MDDEEVEEEALDNGHKERAFHWGSYNNNNNDSRLKTMQHVLLNELRPVEYGGGGYTYIGGLSLLLHRSQSVVVLA